MNVKVTTDDYLVSSEYTIDSPKFKKLKNIDTIVIYGVSVSRANENQICISDMAYKSILEKRIKCGEIKEYIPGLARDTDKTLYIGLNRMFRKIFINNDESKQISIIKKLFGVKSIKKKEDA